MDSAYIQTTNQKVGDSSSSGCTSTSPCKSTICGFFCARIGTPRMPPKCTEMQVSTHSIAGSVAGRIYGLGRGPGDPMVPPHPGFLTMGRCRGISITAGWMFVMRRAHSRIRQEGVVPPADSRRKWSNRKCSPIGNICLPVD